MKLTHSILLIGLPISFQASMVYAESNASLVDAKNLTEAQVSKFVYETTWEGREFPLYNSVDGRPPQLTQPQFTISDLKEADSKKLEMNISREEVVNVNPWIAAMTPSINLRLAVYEAMLSENKLKNGAVNEQSILKGANLTGTDIQNPRDYFLKNGVSLEYASTTPSSTLEDALSITDVNQEVATSMKQIKSELPLLCATRDFFHLKKCTKILSEILDYMEPKLRRSAANITKKIYITAAPDFDKVMKNPSNYIEGLRKAAAKVIRQVDAREVSSHFYDDLFSSYLETGISEEEALRRTWDILAIFAARGQNILSEMREYADRSNYPVFAALQVFSSGAAVLDSLSVSSGHPYSLPAQVHTTGDFGKVYHFWMTAVLAHRYTLKYGNDTPAIHAAQLAITGYEMRSNTFGRDTSRAFTVSPFDTANNKIRLDLSIASAGALFGAQVAKQNNTSIDVDKGLVKLLEKAKDIKPVSTETAKTLWEGTGIKGYIRWLKIFAPNAALKYYLRSSKKES